MFFLGFLPKGELLPNDYDGDEDLECEANVFHSVRRQLGVLFTDALCNDVALLKSFFNDYSIS